jgi:RecA-family ATPase
MIVGDPGLGKSQLTAYIASIVTQEGMWPDKTGCEQSGDVIILSAEDDPACTIVPRLIAAGANLNKINIIEAVKSGYDSRGNPILKQFDFITDIEELDKMLANNKNITTVIIDPLSAYLGNVNSHNNSDVRTVLTPIAKLAEKYNIAMICVSHLNKAGNGNAMSRVSGSVAFIAASRAAFIVVKDKDDAEKRLFIQIKNNLGNCKEGLIFLIEPISFENNITR